MKFQNPLHQRKTVFRIANVCLLLFFAMGILARYTPAAWTDRMDGIRGMLLGMELGLIIWWSRLGGQSCGESS